MRTVNPTMYLAHQLWLVFCFETCWGFLNMSKWDQPTWACRAKSACQGQRRNMGSLWQVLFFVTWSFSYCSIVGCEHCRSTAWEVLHPCCCQVLLYFKGEERGAPNCAVALLFIAPFHTGSDNQALVIINHGGDIHQVLVGHTSALGDNLERL